MVRRRRVLFAGFVTQTTVERLVKCVISGEMVGGKGYSRGQEVGTGLVTLSKASRSVASSWARQHIKPAGGSDGSRKRP